MRKICESLAGGFARVDRTLDRPPQSVEGVLRMQKSGEVVELYGRFMGGSDRNRALLDNQGNSMHVMQIAQGRINTSDYVSC